jgi:tRNA pseudouridine38-40 synthase
VPVVGQEPAGPVPPAAVVDRVRLRLDLSYDGTDFSGWAVQPGRRTVAGELGAALTTLLRTEVPLVVAGRTDAGVHASGQVAHVDVVPEALAALAPRGCAGTAPAGPDGAGIGTTAGVAAGCGGLLRRLAGVLPLDVRVRSVAVAPEGFDARFSALRRRYRYRIGTADWGVEPADRRTVLAFRRAVDVTAMQRAADALVGLHDFAAYCRPTEHGTTVRELQRLDVRASGPDEVTAEVVADAFCHSMVRSLVGTLLAVGQARLESSEPARLLADRRRTSSIPVAPAHGLTLVEVEYPPAAELADRAARTRAQRDAVP